MRTIKFLFAIGLIGMQVGCASNIVVKMPQTTDKAQTELLADVKVMDLRRPGVASSKREAAFGVPMGTVEFDPPAAQFIKQELETELTKLLTEKGIRSKRYYVADLIEFGVNTDTTPLYWDVIGRIHLLVNEGENQHDLFGTHTIRTYVWPGEEIIQKVISESMKQIISGLKLVSAGGMEKPFTDKSASAASKPTSVDKVRSRASLDINSASQFVVIEQYDPAFIVFTGIPKNLDEKKLEEVKLAVSSAETATMLTWQEFLERVDEYARAVILKNDYPNIRVVDGLVCLVASKKGTGAPWGLTWNGGIALTRNDYTHARQTYETYKANPASYKPIRDPRLDPVNPGGHLPFAGCN
jgi:hypothetical protein